MKRLIIVILLVIVLSVATAYGDFKVISMNDLSDRFEQNSSPSSWVNSTDRSRAYFWLSVISDMHNSDPTYDMKNSDELPVAIMGTGDANGTRGFNNTIYMYVRDFDDLFRQVVICPERNYMIAEDAGIPYKKAVEDVSYRAISCFELTYEDVMREIPELKSELDKSQSTATKPESNNTQKQADVESATSSTNNSSLPSLVGPFSGNIIKVKVGNTTYAVHETFKEAMDKYEAFFDSYIEFMKNMDAPDYMVKYSDFMKKYLEAMEAIEKLDKLSEKEKKWSKGEAAYYTQVMLRINEKLYSVIGTP